MLNSSTHFIEQLVAEHSQYLYRIAVSIVRDGPVAEDIVQEAFVTALLKHHKLHAESNYRAWLATIVINRSRDHLRRNKVRHKWHTAWRSLRGLMAESAENRPLEFSVEQEGVSDELWHAIDKLNEKHKIPIVLRYIHGMTAREIAEITGIKEGTVYSRIHTALRQLSGLLATPGRKEARQP